MPFRRKCEDELPPEKPFRVTRRIGPIGPVRLYLMGYSATAFVAFGPGDPSGRHHLTVLAARHRKAERLCLLLPTSPRVDPETFEEMVEESWAAE